MKYIKLRAIIKNLPPDMVKVHKLIYLDNIIMIAQNEAKGYNKGFTECCKNTNHLIIRVYNNI